MRKALLLAGLLGCGLVQAQTTVFTIPALPPGASTPKPTANTPAPTATAPTAPTPSTPSGGPTVTTLPARGTLLGTPHTVRLDGPATITPGQANEWVFTLENAGQSTIHLEHGACDVRFEVLNAAGTVVRPDPRGTVCTMQLVITDVAPGEAQAVQNIRWDGNDASGQSVPAGTYTLRAVFSGAGVRTAPATLQITVP